MVGAVKLVAWAALAFALGAWLWALSPLLACGGAISLGLVGGAFEAGYRPPSQLVADIREHLRELRAGVAARFHFSISRAIGFGVVTCLALAFVRHEMKPGGLFGAYANTFPRGTSTAMAPIADYDCEQWYEFCGKDSHPQEACKFARRSCQRAIDDGRVTDPAFTRFFDNSPAGRVAPTPSASGGP
jgi:hypothetical protein